MKFLGHSIAIAFSLSVLCCLPLIAPLADPAHLFVYHSNGSVESMFWAVLLDVGVLWFAWASVLSLAQRWRTLSVTVWTGIVLLGPWLALKDFQAMSPWPLAHRVSLAVFFGPTLCCLVPLAGWRGKFLPALIRVQRGAGTLLGVYAIYCALLLVQLLSASWEARALNRPLPLHSPLAEREQRSRVIWIVFDELSYQQIYEQRFAGLELPAFDAVANQAAIFTHVVPAGIRTEKVLPSLMTGLPVDAIRSSADGRKLMLHNVALQQWQAFNPRDTVFQDALNAGYRTAVAGWYIPYCRILPQVLDRCFWSSRQGERGGMYGDASFLANAVAPLSQVPAMGMRFLGLSKNASDRDGERHLDDYLDLSSVGDQYLEDGGNSFLLLHMPVPHPFGIYDRKRRVFATQNTTYIDNLALADQYLGHVFSLLKARNEWDSSTIVIMGDHSWRTQLEWVSAAEWTAEENIASHGGQFDDRPGYIVKLPYQTQGTKIDTPFSALRTRALLQKILSGRIRSSADLAAFVNTAQAQ
jgi:hypothetical protein